MRKKTDVSKKTKKITKYSNRWDDPKAIKHKEFQHGIVGLGMSPAENFHETFISQNITQNFNYKRKKHFAISHARIDTKGLKIPDVSFWEKKDNYPSKALVVIELESHRSRSLAFTKCKDALDNHGIKEAFVYTTL